MKVGDLVSYIKGTYLDDLIGIVVEVEEVCLVKDEPHVRVHWINQGEYNLKDSTYEWASELRILEATDGHR